MRTRGVCEQTSPHFARPRFSDPETALEMVDAVSITGAPTAAPAGPAAPSLYDRPSTEYHRRQGADALVARVRGVAVLNDPVLNKGTAHTLVERERLGLRGLLPPRVSTMEAQLAKQMARYRDGDGDLWIDPAAVAAGDVVPEDVRRWHVLTELQVCGFLLGFRRMVQRISGYDRCLDLAVSNLIINLLFLSFIPPDYFTRRTATRRCFTRC